MTTCSKSAFNSLYVCRTVATQQRITQISRPRFSSRMPKRTSGFKYPCKASAPQLGSCRAEPNLRKRFATEAPEHASETFSSAAPPSAWPLRSCAVQGIVAELSGCSRGAAAYGGVGYPKVIACAIANDSVNQHSKALYSRAECCRPLLDTAEATARLRERRGLCAPQRHNAASPPPRAAGKSPIWQFEVHISTSNSMITMTV